MNFQELYDEVVQITKRPDLVGQTESAVKAAVLKAHHSDYFFNDLHEAAVEFDQARFIQTFDPRQVVPEYRQVKYVRIWEGDVSGSAMAFLKHIQIENALDPYGATKTDVFYLAGQYIQIRVHVPVLRILFGSYVHPIVTPASQLKSWIAAEYPYAIIYEAARAMFLAINNQEQSAQMRNLVSEIYGELALSNVDIIPS